MSGIGISGIILLVLIALLLFGPNKLPELGKAFGRTLREFKKGAADLIDDNDNRAPRKIDAADRTEDDAAVKTPERRLPE